MKKRPLSFSVCTAVFIALLAQCAGFQVCAYAAAPPLPEIPQQGMSPSDFVPKGWTIFKQATGDLTGDGRDDYALILTKDGDNPEAGYVDSDFSELLRPLVVLQAEAGVLQKVCVSPGAVMNGQIANDFALLAVDVKIANGNIVVTNANGATSVASYESKYRLQNNKYQLIGFTEMNGNTRESVFSTRDCNLNTSYTKVEDTEGVNLQSGKPSHKSEYSFYSVRAGLVKSPPSMSGAFNKDEWPGLAVWLKRKVNVAKGKANWHDPSDLSAEVYGVHTSTDLFICAKVTRKVPNPDDVIRLVGDDKKTLVPQQTAFLPTDGGALIEARYPLSALKKASIGAFGRIPRGFDLLELSVEIVESDQSGAPGMVLSTSCDEENHRGMIALTKSVDLPTLENLDWAHRDQ